MTNGDLHLIANILALITYISIGGLALLFARDVLHFRKVGTASPSNLPAVLQDAINSAAKFASEYLEELDKHEDLKVKGEDKLNAAVDVAVQYLDSLFKSAAIPVVLDTALIKRIIQKYVWENPDLFPSSKEGTTNGGVTQSN